MFPKVPKDHCSAHIEPTPLMNLFLAIDVIKLVWDMAYGVEIRDLYLEFATPSTDQYENNLRLWVGTMVEEGLIEIPQSLLDPEFVY